MEEVLVEETDTPSIFRLVATPGLVLGVAAGDKIAVDVDAGSFVIISRGGNIAVQVFGPYDPVDSLAKEISALGGRMDGRSSGLTVFTIPASVGFEAVERILNAAIESCPELEWYYGNVYSLEDGVTPLNWWKSAI
jgi:hypothetical protein